MDEITLSKFDPLQGQKSEGIIIKITEDLPPHTPFSNYNDAVIFYEKEAERLVDAITKNLPQGVLYRVLHKLMERYAKDVLYRGKTGT